MLLKGADGSEFELGVVGYQFPQEEDEIDDANWLRIRVRASGPLGSWEATDPSLQTWEVAGLTDWLEDIADKRLTRWPTMEFTEPNLSFEVMENFGSRATLRVYFELELRPPWAAKGWVGQRDMWLDLQVKPEELRAAAGSLPADLARYPQRGELPESMRQWAEQVRRMRQKLSLYTWQRIRLRLRPLS